MVQFDYLLRVLVAGICGALIGYERKSRSKEAGIRTHFVVAVGAALMMTISKYGFQDQLDWPNLGLDPSRVASQVVSGVGFLGAGMIFMQKRTVKGLTTAAGIWATAGVGMAVGSGMYGLGIGVTLLILAAQKVLHGRFNWLASPRSEHLFMRLANEPDALENMLAAIRGRGIEVLSFTMDNAAKETDEIVLEITVRLPETYRVEELLSLTREVPALLTIEVQ
ncbi:MgtC/SapB family protein [Paenibacillus chitinolyticus]|uniref:MgtC/SapB family protein n=1 Tax=Paenibacillus chitinolyticus TaxID=79263 RepID=UPI002DBB77E4|nr:MgtC/SapB family protein [Paenibacillus chitinolyticus]MEC0245223.1 MgtC/SapB family protein [Paenibacillus chitinolyticus]